MNATSTVEVTTYGDLTYGDFFAVELSGALCIAMKVASRGAPSDKPNNEFLTLRSDRPPELQSAQTLKGRRVVAKMNGLIFAVRPQPADFLFDLAAPRARQVGCVVLVGTDIFLAAQSPFNEIRNVNMKTGETFPRIQGRDAVAIARWQIIYKLDDVETPWIEHLVPNS